MISLMAAYRCELLNCCGLSIDSRDFVFLFLTVLLLGALDVV